MHLGVDANFRPATKAHIAFQTADLGYLRTRCQEARCRVVDDEPLETYLRMYVFDPFGNRLEFLERRT